MPCEQCLSAVNTPRNIKQLWNLHYKHLHQTRISVVNRQMVSYKTPVTLQRQSSIHCSVYTQVPFRYSCILRRLSSVTLQDPSIKDTNLVSTCVYYTTMLNFAQDCIKMGVALTVAFTVLQAPTKIIKQNNVSCNYFLFSLGCYYNTLENIRPQYRSTLRAICLVVCVYVLFV